MSTKRLILYIMYLKKECDLTGSNQNTTSAPKIVYLAALSIMNWCFLDVIQIKFGCQVNKVALGWLLMNFGLVFLTAIILSSQKCKSNVPLKYELFNMPCSYIIYCVISDWYTEVMPNWTTWRTLFQFPRHIITPIFYKSHQLSYSAFLPVLPAKITKEAFKCRV